MIAQYAHPPFLSDTRRSQEIEEDIVVVIACMECGKEFCLTDVDNPQAYHELGCCSDMCYERWWITELKL